MDKWMDSRLKTVRLLGKKMGRKSNRVDELARSLDAGYVEVLVLRWRGVAGQRVRSGREDDQ